MLGLKLNTPWTSWTAAQYSIISPVWCQGDVTPLLIYFRYVSLAFRQRHFYESTKNFLPAWWRHQMETFSALLAICAGNSPVTGEFPAQRPVTRSFDVFFDLCLNKRLSKQSWGWWFETPSRSLWRHRNAAHIQHKQSLDGGHQYGEVIARLL